MADNEQYPPHTRFHDEEHIARTQRKTAEGHYDLNSQEIWWRDRQLFLQSKGYILRPRFRPGWVPSWKGTNIIPLYCEDALRNVHGKTLDATQASTGQRVVIKAVPSNSDELDIACFLTTPEKLQDPQNHCVPILDHFPDPSSTGINFMVMPILRRFLDPPFVTVHEVVDFMQQVLDGLVFIHKQGVAHRDCAYLNIMLDGRPLYPDGYHFSAPGSSVTRRGAAKHLQRSDVPSVKYYLTDFGISSRFPDANQSHLVVGKDGQDRDVPELSWTIPYDPFPVDIFTAGNLFTKVFVDNYSNLEFLRPLTESMTRRDPNERPTAQESLSRFQALVAGRPHFSLRWRLRDRRSPVTIRLFRDLSSASREGLLLAKRLIGSPFALISLIVSGSASVLAVLYGPREFLTRLRSTFSRADRHSR